MGASWGCHQCVRIGLKTTHYAPWVWLAKRLSVRHEYREHGRSVYAGIKDKHEAIGAK